MAPRTMVFALAVLLSLGSAFSGAEDDPPAPAGAGEEPEQPRETSAAGGLIFHYGSVHASFQFFGDVGGRYQSDALPSSAHSSFAVGSIDVFTSVQLSDHFQVLSEMVAEFDPATNEVGFEVERLWGLWARSGRFYFKAGREHSPVSRWNRRFHHGKIFWLSATQPFAARFEDAGGPLPIHQTGFEAGGRIRTALGQVQYTGVVSNGRGSTPLDVTNASDRNGAKAFDLGLGVSRGESSSTAFGFNLHLDEIPPDPADPLRSGPMTERIGTLYLDHHGEALDAMGEAVLIRHHDQDTRRRLSHNTGYIQVGYRIKDTTPYARFDVRVMDRDDPFFLPTGLDLDRWEQIVGIRWDVDERAAVKLEAGFGRGEMRDDSGEVRHRAANSASVQLSWGF